MGHSNKDCLMKGKQYHGAVRAVEEEELLLLQAVSSVEFAPARRTARPMPRSATLGDFLSRNTFAELASEPSAEVASKPSQGGETRRAPTGPAAAPRDRASTGPAAAPRDDRGVASRPPSPGYTSTTSANAKKISDSTTSAITKKTTYIDATKATAKAYGETGGRRATADDNHYDDDHNDNHDGHDVRLVGPSNDATPAKAKCRDVRGGVAPPLTSLRQAKRHGADASA